LHVGLTQPVTLTLHSVLFVGDLSASEMTMSDEDRIQLMLLVKEGKISVQEAVDTVSIYMFNNNIL